MLAALVALSLLASPTAAPALPRAGRLLLGVQDDALLTSGEQLAWPLARGLRPGVIRFNVAWDQVARRRPRHANDPADPAYDWSRVDLVARNALSIGAQPLFTLGGAPPFANGGRAPAVAPRSAVAFGQFCAAVAQRYSGEYVPAGATEALPQVRLYTVWNEPNRGQYFRPQGEGGRTAPRLEAALMRRCAPAIHARVPAARVALGPLASRGAQGGMSPLGFLRAYRRAGGPPPDVVALNPYLEGLEPAYRPDEQQPDAAVTIRNLDQLRSATASAFGRPLPVWLTEFAFRTGFQKGMGVITPDRQAALTRNAVRLVRRHYPYVQLFVWFLLRDESATSYWRSGLVHTSWARKPAYRVWAAGAPEAAPTPAPVAAPRALWSAVERAEAGSVGARLVRP